MVAVGNKKRPPDVSAIAVVGERRRCNLVCVPWDGKLVVTGSGDHITPTVFHAVAGRIAVVPEVARRLASYG